MKLNKISLKYLSGQKKHTVITIIAITVSIAFMTVLLSAMSIYRTSALNAALEKNGSYHVVFNDLDKPRLVTLRSMDIFDETEIYSVSAYNSNTDIDFSQMPEKQNTLEYLSRSGNLIDDVFLRIKPDEVTLLPDAMTHITDGRLPEKDGEIVISEKSAFMWDYPELNSTVSASLITCGEKTGASAVENVPQILCDSFDIVSNEEVTFTVVGYSSEYNLVHYSDTRLKSYSYLTDNMVARFSEKTNDLYWDMHYAFEEKGFEIDNFSYGLNQELLDLEGKGVDAKFSQAIIFAVMYLAIIFLMFCVRLVIDNCFEISAKERIKQFGLLKAVGASKKQIFSLVLWEAFYLAIPGVIMGILLGTGSAALIFNAVKGMDSIEAIDIADCLEFNIAPFVYISSAVIGILWVCISAVATGLRFIKASPVEAMNSAGKKEKLHISRKPSKLEKGGSFIGAYSSLSVKRNRKRYGITILSLVLSITMFSGFSYGVEIARNNTEQEFEQKRAPYDYNIEYATFFPDSVADEVERMKASGFFTDVQWDSSMTLYVSAAELGISPETPIYDHGNLILILHPIGKEAFEKHITTDSGITYSELAESGKILLASDMYENNEFSYNAYAAAPESFSSQLLIASLMEFREMPEISCGGTYKTDNRIYRSADNLLCAVTSEEHYDLLTAQLGVDSNISEYPEENGEIFYLFTRNIYANCAEGMEENAVNYLNRNYYNSYANNTEDMRSSKASLEITALLGYFIIGIAALIAAVNIVNIISANVLGRTSELAMLRACGMSDKQLYQLILREGVIYAATASIISFILIEAALLAIQIPFMTNFHDLTYDDLGFVPSFTAPVPYILIAAAAAFIAAVAASYFPARRIIRTPVVENIRNSRV